MRVRDFLSFKRTCEELKLHYYKVIKMSLKKTLAKALTGVALVSSLYGLPVKKANAFEIVLPSGFIIEIPDKDSKNKHSNKLYKQKKEEFDPSKFNPPELPYCKLQRADGMGVVIYYYPKWYKKTGDYYRLSWIVDNLFRPSVGDIVVDYMYSAGYNVDLGARDKAFIQDCLLRATRKVLERTGGGVDGYGPYSLVVRKMEGNIFGDYIIQLGPPY